MITPFNIDIIQGVCFSLLINANDDNGNPVDLTNYSITGYIKDHFSSTGILAYFSPNIVSPATSGTFIISLDSPTTSGLLVGQDIYEVRGLLSGCAKQFLQGYANIYPQ